MKGEKKAYNAYILITTTVKLVQLI